MEKARRKKKVVGVFAGTRSEYGLLRPLIFQLREEGVFDVKILAASGIESPGAEHMADDVRRDGFSIHKYMETLLVSDSPSAISKSMALGLLGSADYFAEVEPDMLVVLGDRHLTLAVCCAALHQRVPIVHIGGGEITQGSLGDAIRQAITKMSYLHFTSAEIYRKRVIQLGEDPERVFNVGSLVMDNILQVNHLLSKEDLEKSLGFALGQPYAVVAFRPAVLEEENVAKQCAQLLKALHKHRELNYIFLHANADVCGHTVNSKIDTFVNEHSNAVGFVSLNTQQYLSAIKYATMMIGNSSGGIFDAPIFRVPTVNVGDRQRGRLQSGSIINCPPTMEGIHIAIRKARDPEFLKNMEYRSALYGDGEAAKKIVAGIVEFLGHKRSSLQKQFYDF